MTCFGIKICRRKSSYAIGKSSSILLWWMRECNIRGSHMRQHVIATVHKTESIDHVLATRDIVVQIWDHVSKFLKAPCLIFDTILGRLKYQHGWYRQKKFPYLAILLAWFHVSLREAYRIVDAKLKWRGLIITKSKCDDRSKRGLKSWLMIWRCKKGYLFRTCIWWTNSIWIC